MQGRKIRQMRTQTQILVVDDEKEIADLVEWYLSNEGYTVRKAHTGHDALRLLADACPDLALLDVMLPDIDGFAPVSYTHLDVYKRQLVRNAQGSFVAWSQLLTCTQKTDSQCTDPSRDVAHAYRPGSYPASSNPGTGSDVCTRRPHSGYSDLPYSASQVPPFPWLLPYSARGPPKHAEICCKARCLLLRALPDFSRNRSKRIPPYIEARWRPVASSMRIQWQYRASQRQRRNSLCNLRSLAARALPCRHCNWH